MSNAQFLSSKLCAYPSKGKLPGLASVQTKQIGVFNVRAVNASGGLSDIGLGRLQGSAALELLSVTTAGPNYTVLAAPSVSAPVQIFSGAANQGYVVGSYSPLNLIGVTVSTAAAGGVFVIEQWNGSAWAAAGSIIESPANYSVAADTFTVVMLNSNVAKGGDSALLSPYKYYTRIYTTGALAGPVLVNNLWAMSFLEFRSGVADTGQLSVQFDWRQPFLLEGGEGLAPYFSVPAADNQFGVFYTLL